MTTRNYSSRSQQTTLTAGITSSATTMTVLSGTALMGGTSIALGQTFTAVIDPDTALEEIVDVTAVATNTLTITRGIDGSSGQAHSAGAIVRHMVIGRDLREANTHIENTTSAHGLTIANVLQTSSTGVVTGSMIAATTITDANISNTAAIANSKLATNPLDRANHTGTQLAATVSNFDTQVRTSRLDQMAAPTASVAMNSQKITGLATPTSNTDAATKAYADGLITALVASSPTTLDTLNELATALGNDANFATTTATALAGKLPLAGGTMSGAIAMGGSKITGLGTPTATTDATTKAYVDATMVGAPGNLTGVITSLGAATSIASQTGTGTKFVVDTSPTLITPVIGAATGSSLNVTGALTGGTHIANATVSGTSTTGAYSYGALGYSDTNHILTMQTNVNSYAQMEIQNTNAGTTASADVVVSSNNATATTNYGNLGINSSGFTGTGALNTAGATYLTATSGELAIGTTTANGIHFVVNSGATDAMTISSAGAVTIAGHPTIEGVTSTGATGTGALVFANTPTLVTPVIGAATGTSLALSGDLTSTKAGAFTSLTDFEMLTLMGAL